ncbi:hypothetical protein ACN38_g3057 [Penicillium nordicum]|uniref:Uncharacterized protein n=1 Tax=Penicillium nordicum TaxID=229535 RepID=A0A0M9WIC6_9EURO|nr:hypothetical protein ACN38_g3057 [Penicillium nordicum]
MSILLMPKPQLMVLAPRAHRHIGLGIKPFENLYLSCTGRVLSVRILLQYLATTCQPSPGFKRMQMQPASLS